MRTWAHLLSGLIIWTVHFFALYIVASIWLTTTLARGLTLAITIACLAAVGFFLVREQRRQAENPMGRWVRAVASLGLGIAGIAILWQGLPALLS